MTLSRGEKHHLLYLGSSGSNEARLTKTSDSNHENMSLIYDINNQMCEKVEIFDALAPIRNADARGNGQLRRHLELEYQKLQSQSVKEPQGVSV